MDRRIQRTRAAIASAFESLLTEKRYEQITVQDIIDRANIGRSTFYAHFETKDELLRALCGDIFEHVFSPDLTEERTHDFSQSSAWKEFWILNSEFWILNSASTESVLWYSMTCCVNKSYISIAFMLQRY